MARFPAVRVVLELPFSLERKIWVLFAVAPIERLGTEVAASGSKDDSRLPRLAPTRPPESVAWLGNFIRADAPKIEWPSHPAAIDSVSLRAGLLIWHDFLDEGHELAQSIEGQAPGRGDHWHAIMHRREPDYGNAKYWFRRIREPAWFAELAKFAETALTEAGDSKATTWRDRLTGRGKWDPLAFVDLCESIRDEESPLGRAARRIQRYEMERLLADCFAVP